MKQHTRETTTQDTSVTAARAVVEQTRSALAHWEAEEATATAELASLEERAGEELLDNPETSKTLAVSMQELRDRADIASRAIEAARPRVAEAESAYLNAEADRLQPIVDEARAALAKHEKRTAELVAALTEHDGPYVPEQDLIMERRNNPGVMDPPTSWRAPKSEAMARRVREAEQPVRILRDMAAGELRATSDYLGHGQKPADAFPSCVWGPEALVPAPAYVAWRDRQEGTIESIREDRIPKLEEALEKLEAERAEYLETLGGYAGAATYEQVPPEARKREAWLELHGRDSWDPGLLTSLESAKRDLRAAHAELEVAEKNLATTK